MRQIIETLYALWAEQNGVSVEIEWQEPQEN